MIDPRTVAFDIDGVVADTMNLFIDIAREDYRIDWIRYEDITLYHHFVEDRLDTCFSLDSAGIIPILFKQPWNRETHPFDEVGTWSELSALIGYS